MSPSPTHKRGHPLRHKPNEPPPTVAAGSARAFWPVVAPLIYLALMACSPALPTPTTDPSSLRTALAARAFATDTAYAGTAAPSTATASSATDTTVAIPTVTPLPSTPAPPPTAASPVNSPTAISVFQTFRQRTKTSGCVAANGLPDPACTPGAIFPDATTSQICTPGYSASVRNVPDSVKNQVYAAYGITSHAPGQYEIDHLISLELGGSNDIANLFPQAADPRPGFHEKDQVENWLHDQVCRGAIPLSDAQAGIARNWLQFYAPALSVFNTNVAQTPYPTTVSATPAVAPTLGIIVLSLTSPAYRNSNATIMIQTAPAASCSIVVNYKSGPSGAQGLGPMTADLNGRCTWTWKVGGNTTTGTWSVSVTASQNGMTQSISTPFVVQ